MSSLFEEWIKTSIKSIEFSHKSIPVMVLLKSGVYIEGEMVNLLVESGAMKTEMEQDAELRETINLFSATSKKDDIEFMEHDAMTIRNAEITLNQAIKITRDLIFVNIEDISVFYSQLKKVPNILNQS